MMSPLHLAAALFVLGLPLLEIGVLIEVGRWLGLWTTLGLLVLSAAAGMLIIRSAGTAMVGRMLDGMGRGGLGIASLIDSYATISAGFLLIVPGFITDAIGAALLVPPLRRALLRALLPGFAGRPRDSSSPTDAQTPAKGPIIIEGTYQRLDDDSDTKR
jgi:UPF0716 protein FxsA